MSLFFVAGTGTDIGKTFVACGLIRALIAKRVPVEALKPVASGITADQLAESDPGRLLAALGQAPTADEVARICPWRFEAPLSPHMAARRENRAVDFSALVAFSKQHMGSAVRLVEGVGGVIVPLDDRHTTLDWMTALAAPVILVTGSYLGSISHTLSAIDVLKHRGIRIAALVVSESAETHVPLQETLQSIVDYGGPLEAIAMPRAAELQTPAFAELAEIVLRRG